MMSILKSKKSAILFLMFKTADSGNPQQHDIIITVITLQMKYRRIYLIFYKMKPD